MENNEKILTAVCAIVCRRKLRAREVVSELKKRHIEIDRSSLNSLLYGSMRDLPGLEVSEGVWSYRKGRKGETRTHQSESEAKPEAPNSPMSETAGSTAAESVAAENAVVHEDDRALSLPLSSESVLDFKPDPYQHAVITRPADARVFVEAGPGTGKTAVACLRIARLINEEGVNPANVLVVTFTRTAVAEIRLRAAHYLGPDVAAQIAITTIDASAWRFDRMAMDADRELTSYDQTIASALKHIRSRDPSLLDLLESFEHVILDEAQDVTGSRNELVVTVIQSLSKSCGVTIFADPLQSIYGFTLDQTTIIAQNPVQLLRERLPDLECLELRVAHRFSPELGKFLSGARTIAASDILDGVEKQHHLAKEIREEATPLSRDFTAVAKALAGKQNVLVLFRSRREVIQASSFFLATGVSHQLRMSGIPDCIQPWIARVFADFTEATITESSFMERFTSRCESMLPHELGSGAAWALLRRLAPAKRGAADIAKLRGLLSRTRPPVDVCFVDGSPLGPILGTVHASKGREADEVYLLLPPVIEEGDAEEESRVLYVAVTRAKKRLHAAGAVKAWGDRLEGSGRCFALDKTHAGAERPVTARLEVGRADDQHECMTVSERLLKSAASVAAAQDLLWRNRAAVRRLTAERQERGTEYWLSFDDEAQNLMLGTLSRKVLDDARLIAKHEASGWPGSKLMFVFSVGSRTAVVPPDSRELEHIHEPYCRSGFHLVPIVRGYCRTYINYSGGHR